MNILLIAMPDVHPGFLPWFITGPNLGLASIAGSLDSRRQVKIADLILKRKNIKKAVKEALKASRPDIVGLSAMTFQYDTALKIARFIKMSAPGIKIALGGYHATLQYKEIAESHDGNYFDFIFRGESELSFKEMVDKIETGQDLTSVDGISFKSDGGFVHNKKRELEKLNRLRLPDREARLWNGYRSLGLPFDTIESSRGCTMGCKFCSIRNMYGNSFRAYEISRVIKDIEYAKSLGTRSLFFIDDNITLNVKRFEELCDAIIESGNNDVHYSVQASSAGISSSERLVQKIARAGFKTIFLGMENVSRKNLEYLRKGDILEKSKQAVEYLKKYRIIIVGGLITGNPEDTEEDIEINYKFIRDQKIDISLDQIVTPYLKTVLREELAEAGLITNFDNYKTYDGYGVNVRTKYLNARQLAYLKWKFQIKYIITHSKFTIFKTNIFKHYWWFVLQKVPYQLVRKIIMSMVNSVRSEEAAFRSHQRKYLKLNRFNL